MPARLEAAVKGAGIGLWNRTNPTAPWGWRCGEGVTQAAGVVSNGRSSIYQVPTCPRVARMVEKNCVSGETVAQAEAAGYWRARDCR